MEGNRDSDPPRFVYVSGLRTRGNLTDPDAEVAAWKRRQGCNSIDIQGLGATSVLGNKKLTCLRIPNMSRDRFGE